MLFQFDKNPKFQPKKVWQKCGKTCLKQSKSVNAYFAKEKNDSYDGKRYADYLKDAHYTADKNEFFPIPYNQLFYIPGLYTQNKGY